MPDVGLVALSVFGAGAALVAGWALRSRHYWRREAQKTDLTRLAERMGLDEFKVTKRLSKDELGRYVKDRDTLARSVIRSMRRQLVDALAREGALVLLEKRLPAKPYVEYEMKVTAATEWYSDAHETLKEARDRANGETSAGDAPT